MDLNQFRSDLSRLLKASGSRLAEADVRTATKECRDGIYADQAKTGLAIDGPFFNLICLDDIAVFTFFETEFSVFIVRCEERDLIAKTERLALCETEACKDLLWTTFEKRLPDLTIPRTLAEFWLT